jgi:hypothetical protein
VDGLWVDADAIGIQMLAGFLPLQLDLTVGFTDA